jgi:hypothetical protein
VVQPAAYAKPASIKPAPDVTTAPISPAGCQIEKLDNPHPSESVGKTLPGMHIKVNSKTQCDKPVTQIKMGNKMTWDCGYK